jgi:hypothetical protein
VDTGEAARRWAEGWARAWAAHDADAVAALYASEAMFLSHPFREPQAPRDYAAWAFADEDELIESRWGEPRAAGNRAAVEWWAVVRTGERVETIAGVSMLRFREDGLVTEQRDYWAIQEGRREPRPGWGR